MVRLIAKIIRDLIATSRFESFLELTDALHRRLHRLRIRHTQAEFDDAINLVAASAPLVVPPPPAVAAEPPSEEPPISRADAPGVLADVRRELTARGLLAAEGPRSMPQATPLTPTRAGRVRFRRDEARALGMVLDEIDATPARRGAGWRRCIAGTARKASA